MQVFNQLGYQNSKNKPNNITFKGTPDKILMNLAEDLRPDVLRNGLSNKFREKIKGHFATEEHFDAFVKGAINRNGNLDEEAAIDLSRFAYMKSRIQSVEKFLRHTIPKPGDFDILDEYTRLHPQFKYDYQSARTQRDAGTVVGGLSGLGTILSVAAAPFTGGLSLAGTLLAGGAGYAGGLVTILHGNNARAKIFEKAEKYFAMECVNYKLKSLIAKGRLSVNELKDKIKSYL